MQNRKKKYLIFGLGKTGLSCLNFLNKKKFEFSVVDTRSNPPYYKEATQFLSVDKIHIENFSSEYIENTDTIVLSPGIPLGNSYIKLAQRLNKKIIGDIELFVLEAKAPIIAVTGTNGKSTVSTLISKMAEKSGYKVLLGGNIGTPALDLLKFPTPDLYVLELSSFQLQLTYSMKFDVAVLLNLTEDHLDHHKTIKNYIDSKLRIFNNCKTIVINKKIKDLVKPIKDTYYFSAQPPELDSEYGLTKTQNDYYLANNSEQIININRIKISGYHNIENCLAALAAGTAFGMKKDAMVNVLTNFKGLKHRCQLVCDIKGIKWYNDSKATNIGAANASIEGLGKIYGKNIILISGGIGKGQDFNLFTSEIKKYVKNTILFGQDKLLISNCIKKVTKVSIVETLQNAVQLANNTAKKGDIVLFAPACSSFDMFKNFEHRGDEFVRLVKQLSK